MDNYFDFQLQRFEAGQMIVRLAGFKIAEHAISFADSLLKETTKEQFLVIGNTGFNVLYIKQGLKPAEKNQKPNSQKN